MFYFKLKTCIIFIFLAVNVYCQSVQFFREKIELHIYDSYCNLKGYYYFKNISKKEISTILYYPFVVNDELPYPDSVSIKELVNNTEVDFLVSEKGIRFPLHIPEKSIIIYEINYFQRTPANKMEYILTTTQKWKRPLFEAEYIITIPNNTKLYIKSFSFDKKKYLDDRNIYYMKKKNFMPKENLIISWKREKK